MLPTLKDLSTFVEQRTALVFWSIFALAFAIRFAILLTVPHEMMISNGEASQIASALVHKGEFADPYIDPTGPTAHTNPFFPALLAGFYLVFGEGYAGAFASCVALISAYSVLYALSPAIAAHFAVPRVAGALSGFLQALLPVKRSAEVFRSWEESFAAMLLALVLILVVKRPARHAGLVWGAVIGVSLYVSASLAPAIACVALVDIFRSHRRGESKSTVAEAIRHWAIAAMVSLVLVAPWLIRNRAVIGQWFFMRDNFGLELSFSNHDGAGASSQLLNARRESYLKHPSNNPAETEQVRKLGEWEYNQRKMREAREWIVLHPVEFARLTGQHFVYFWLGPKEHPAEFAVTAGYTLMGWVGLLTLVRRRARPGVSTFWIAALIGYSCVYYFVQYLSRYRVPIDWMLWLPAGWVVLWAYAKVRHESLSFR